MSHAGQSQPLPHALLTFVVPKRHKWHFRLFPWCEQCGKLCLSRSGRASNIAPHCSHSEELVCTKEQSLRERKLCRFGLHSRSACRPSSVSFVASWRALNSGPHSAMLRIFFHFFLRRRIFDVSQHKLNAKLKLSFGYLLQGWLRSVKLIVVDAKGLARHTVRPYINALT